MGEEKWANNYVPRAEWGGREPKSITNMAIPAPTGVIGHHTAGGRCSSYSACVSQMKGMQNYHMDSLGWVDIGFPVAGDFSNTAPNKAAKDAATQLLSYLERKNFVRRSCWSFYGHRDKDATICPGNPLYAEWGKHKNWHKRC